MDLSGTGFEQWVIPTIAVFCILLGEALKRAFEKFPNRAIPLCLGAVGVIFNAWMNAWALSPEILIIGFVSGVAGTGLFEVMKSFRKSGVE